MTTEAEKALAKIVAGLERVPIIAAWSITAATLRLIADGFTALKAERDRLHEADLRWGKLHQRVIDERAAEIRAREAAETAIAAAKARIAELEGANEKLAKQIRAASQWYWPEDDTSSEACRESVREVFEQPGTIGAYSCGGVVYTGYYGWLPPSDDADSDDEFEVDEPTREAAEAKMAEEIARRAALESKP